MKRTIYFIMALTAISCQSEKATTSNTPKINIFEKPIKNVDVQLQNLQANSEEGDTLYLANNTRIIIPNNAFVDSLGNSIKGKVDINFKEYHTEAEVILSGIPMQYHSIGTEYTLETDGMFKISGEQNGSKVEIAPNKKLKVKTQSYKEDTPCFNYYTQNKKGQWNFKNSKERSINEEAVVKNELKKIKQLDENSIGLDLRINTEKYPELKSFKNITWIYNGNNPDTLKHKLLSKVRWNEFELQKTDESFYSYLLIGTHKRHQFTMPIAPAFTSDEIKIVKKQIVKRIKEQELAYKNLQNQYEREAVINNFGTHNWDRCVKADMLVMKTRFNEKLPIKYFYVVNKSDKYKFVNKYKNNAINHVKFVQNGDYIVIAFLEKEGEVAYALNDQLKGNDQSYLTVYLNKQTKTIKKPSDLQDIIDLI